MPLSNRYRRLSVAPVAHLERQGCGSLGGGSSAGRIQNSFPEGSHFIQGTHPFSGLLSQLHPGQGLGAGSGVSASERSHRTGSTSFPGLLQRAVCYDEGLRVVATHHRPLSLEPHGVKDAVQDGDPPFHPVVCPQGGLDGLHRPSGCISSNSNPSGIQKISTVHGLREGLPIQDPLFWSSHGSTSLCAGHGSGFGNSSQSWHSAPPLSGRLADSGILPRAGSPVFKDSAPTLQLSGDRRQLGEIPACSDSNSLLSGSHIGLNQFPGFSSPETDRQAALNWRRISILCGAACEILAGVAGSAVLSNSAHSGGSAADAVVPVCPSPLLESRRSRRTHSVVSRDSPGSSLVAQPRTSRTRNLTRTSVPPARLVVRRLGCRLGAHLGDQVASGRWSSEELHSSINHRELLAIFYALQHFLSLVRSTSVAVYADNTTALAYLRHQGGTRSALLNRTEQQLLRWAEVHSITLLPQFIMGRNNVLADALSCPNQILGSEWTLKLSVFHRLRQRWPVMIDFFATSQNHCCLPYFSPFHDPNSIGTDALLQRWDGWQAYAFPPYVLILAVLKKLRSSSGVLLTIIAPYWPQRPWFPELLELLVDGPVALPLDRDLLSQPHVRR